MNSLPHADDVLRLVRRALDEFETVALESSIRRAIRIATLLGETEIAVRLSYEIRPLHGHPPSNKADTIMLMADESQWLNPDGAALRAHEAYVGDRTQLDSDKISAHSIAELEFFDALPAGDLPLATVLEGRRIMSLAKHRTFVALCAWERSLTFAATHESALERVNARVQRLLDQYAPDIQVQFNVAFLRLRECLDRDSGASVAEELTHVTTSCRRILKAVVDVIQPADPARPTSDDGHRLTDQEYKNRLVEFLKTVSSSGTLNTGVKDFGRALFERFDGMDALASKGVHAEVAFDEAEFCALATYLLAGELLALNEAVQLAANDIAGPESK